MPAELALTGELQLSLQGKSVAQLRFHELEASFELDLLLVRASHRGQGLGTRLLERLLALADASGKPVVTTARPIGSSAPGTLARLERYYATFGFELAGRGVSSTLMKRPVPSAARPQACG